MNSIYSCCWSGIDEYFDLTSQMSSVSSQVSKRDAKHFTFFLVSMTLVEAGHFPLLSLGDYKTSHLEIPIRLYSHLCFKFTIMCENQFATHLPYAFWGNFGFLSSSQTNWIEFPFPKLLGTSFRNTFTQLKRQTDLAQNLYMLILLWYIIYKILPVSFQFQKYDIRHDIHLQPSCSHHELSQDEFIRKYDFLCHHFLKSHMVVHPDYLHRNNPLVYKIPLRGYGVGTSASYRRCFPSKIVDDLFLVGLLH